MNLATHKKPSHIQTCKHRKLGTDVCTFIHPHTHKRIHTNLHAQNCTCTHSNMHSYAVSRLCGCWSRAEYQRPSSDSLSWAMALGTRRRGGGLTSMCNRKGTEGGGEKEMEGFRSSAAITGRLQWSEDSQLILFTFYSL